MFVSSHRQRYPAAVPTAAAAVLLLALGVAPRSADAAESVRFGMQAWPGVTVKTQVATRILDALGYDSGIKELGPQFVYQGMETGDVDVTLGTWMPAHKPMLQPLIDAGEAELFAVNLEGAVQGLAVPQDVCDAGIRTVDDLVAEGERFDRKIYAIGSGAAMTEAFQQAVEADYKGLGDWQVVSSSTAGMLSQVDRAVADGRPIVFHGWKPHWMDVEYELCFLEGEDNSEIADIESTVYTVTRSGWAGENPQAAGFLSRFKVDPDTQSAWIYGFSYEERPAAEVAEDWIRNNMDQVATWLDGVEAADGTPGPEAVRAAMAEG